MPAKDFWNRSDIQLGALGLVALGAGAAFWIADGPRAALPPFIALCALGVLLWFGRGRSDTIATMTGLGDERTRQLNQRAMTTSANVLAFVIGGWWLVTVATGDPNETLMTLATVFGVSYIAASAFHARRP